MNTTKTIFHLLFLALPFIGGCATVPDSAPPFSPAPAAPRGFALVYFYRLDAPPYTQTIKLSVAGKPIIDAPERAYSWAHVKAGTHTVLADWPKVSGWQPASTTVAFEAGETYYVRAVGRLESPPFSLFGRGGFVPMSYVTSLPPGVGRAEIRVCCRYMRSITDVVDIE
jgi:hypothetical protein